MQNDELIAGENGEIMNYECRMMNDELIEGENGEIMNYEKLRKHHCERSAAIQNFEL